MEVTYCKTEDLITTLTEILSQGSAIQPMMVQIFTIQPYTFTGVDEEDDTLTLTVTNYMIVWQAAPLPQQIMSFPQGPSRPS